MAAPAEPRFRLTPRVAGCLKTAMEAMARSRWADAVERFAAAAVADIQQENAAFLGFASEAAFITDHYAQCFAGASLHRQPREAFACSRGGPVRVGYVMASVAEGQAASKQLVQLARLFDRNVIDPVVLVAEEFTQRTPALQFLRWPAAPSEEVGGEMIAQIRAAGVPVTVVPPTGDHLDGARRAIDLARAARLDIGVFIASPACPIQAAMAWARVAPVQVNHDIGVAMPIDGIDAVLYHNAITAANDSLELQRRGIGILNATTIGTDATAGSRAVAISRAELGVPDDAVVLMNVGNKLPDRFAAGDFAQRLARFMVDHPDAWWVGIGRGDLQKAIQPLVDAGVSHRAITIASQPDPIRYIKSADLFLNEYPEGGGNTVMEAMSCAVPVVAMAAGHPHGHNIGAQLVGSPHAIDRNDPDAYWSLVNTWHASRQLRQAVGAELQQRVTNHLDFAAICRQYERHFTAIASSRRSRAG